GAGRAAACTRRRRARGARASAVAARDSARPGALQDRGRVDAGRQGAERLPVVAGEPRADERVGHRRRRDADQERALQRERHPLDQPARPALDVGEVAELVAERVDERIEARVLAATAVDLAEERVDRLALAPHRAEHVETDDVARAFPYA